ncbi:MAG: non-homologous end-joining DNA ligase [Planctomycetota bacterium]
MITHPEKVLFPDDGITKGELAAYYQAIAPLMLPHLRARPVTMERYPQGIGEKGFFHKDVARGFPAWLERVAMAKKDGVVHHPIVMDARALSWIANQNCITLHVSAARAPDLLHPDLCIFDLDPSVDDDDALRRAALEQRALLAELDLTSWVKTSGSKGFHLAVPLDRQTHTGEVAWFAHRVGARLVERDPETFTQEFHKVDRGGRILIDTGRNDYSATFAAAYTVRARAGAPVSAPCTWQEIERGTVGPRSFALRTMAARVAAVGDPWVDLPGTRARCRVRSRSCAKCSERCQQTQAPTARNGSQTRAGRSRRRQRGGNAPRTRSGARPRAARCRQCSLASDRRVRAVIAAHRQTGAREWRSRRSRRARSRATLAASRRCSPRRPSAAPRH